MNKTNGMPCDKTKAERDGPKNCFAYKNIVVLISVLMLTNRIVIYETVLPWPEN